MSTNRNTRQDVFRVIKKKLMYTDIFYGFFISTLQKLVVRKGDPLYEAIPTAAVSPSQTSINYMLYINEDFWWSLTEDLKVAVLKHEVDHIIYFHPTMAQSFSDKALFNIAADLTINQNIPALINETKKMSLEDYLKFCEENKEAIAKGEIAAPPRYAILEDYDFDPRLDRNKGTKFYYDRLMAERSKNTSLAKLIEMAMASQAKGNPSTDNHQTWKDFDRNSVQENDILNHQTATVLKEILKNTEGSVTIGNLPAHLRDLIKELITPKRPVVDWKRVLRHFASYSTEYYTKPSRRKLNKRVEEFSSIRLYTKKKLFVGLDTSGSMGDDDIRECFSEIHNIWKSGVSVTIGECDAQLDRKKDVYEYKGVYPKNRKGLSGGGGTSCNPLIEYVNDNADKYTCFVYLTDGYLYDNKEKCKKPMLTVLTSNGENLKKFREEMENFGKIVKMQPLN